MRMCQVTQLRMPSALLIPQTIKREPDTGKAWQVPAGFQAVDLDTAKCKIVHPVQEAKENAPTDGSNPQIGADSHSTRYPLEEVRRGKGEMWSYMAGTHEVQDYRTSAKQKESSKFTSTYWADRLTESFVKNLGLRKDMPTLVLNLMQGRVMRLLVELALKGVPCVLPWASVDSWYFKEREKPDEEGESGKPVLLWLGPSKEVVSAPAVDALSSTIADKPALPFAESSTQALNDLSLDLAASKLGLTLETRKNGYHFHTMRCPDGARLSAFDLNDLLNVDQIRWLRERDPIYQQTALAIFPVLRSAEVLSWLWRLVIYIGGRKVRLKESD